MKKFFIVVLLFSFAGCSLFKSSVKYKSKDHYSIKDNKVVMFDGKPYAELQAVTWSLDGG
jgi:hypothetical protein